MNKQFKQMNVRGGGAPQSRGPPPAQQSSGVDGKSTVMINMFAVKATKNIPIYKYDVKIRVSFLNGYEKELTTERFDDKRRQCSAVIAHVAKTEQLGDYAHNRAACLYSLSNFKNKELVFDVKDLPELASDFDEGTCTVNIDQGPQDTFQTSTNDLVSCIPGRPGYQPNLLEALNILLEREAFSKPDQWFSRDAIHFQLSNVNAVELGGGVILKPGLRTSAEVVGDDEKNLHLVVAADIKTVVQHVPMTLDKKIDELKKVKCHDLNSVLFGLSVVPTYGKKRVPFTIQTVNQLKTIKQIIDGKTIDNEEYFNKTYGITLKRRDLPMVAKRARNSPTGYIYYPAEVLQILPNQSVPKERQLPVHTEQIVRWSAMLPKDRVNLCYDYMTRLGLFDNQNLKKFGFELGTKFMELPCTVLSGVLVNGFCPRDNSKVDLRSKTFHAPPELRNWAMINYGCDPDYFKDFKKWMCDSLKAKGVKMTEPADINISSDLAAEKLLIKAKDSGFQFVFIALGDRILIHDDIKYYEQKYQVVTQIVTASLIRKAIDKNQAVTMDNVMLKTCLKNGGVPYGVETSKGELKIRTNDVLYIGVEFSHQQGTGGTSRRFKRRPSRLGYAATCSFHPNQVIGDWVYIDGHNNEKAFDAVVEIISQCKAAFTKARKGAVPKTVVLYLSGYSEGQWSKLRAETQKAKDVLGATKLVVVLENKKTSERLYKTDRAGDRAQQTNIQPGVCLDHTVLTPGCKGFYLNPHVILQGTACSPKYTVLVNDAGVSLTSIEYATHALSFLHSVCTSPTAEVAVLTIADRCAKRGQTVLNYYMRKNNLDEITVEEANKELTNPLAGRCHALRFNA